MAAGAAKSKGAESFPICPLCKNIFVLHPRFPHLFGGSFGISVSDRKQQACAAAVQICGAFCFPYTAGGLHIAEKLPFPRCRMDGIFIYSVIERFHRVSLSQSDSKEQHHERMAAGNHAVTHSPQQNVEHRHKSAGMKCNGYKVISMPHMVQGGFLSDLRRFRDRNGAMGRMFKPDM